MRYSPVCARCRRELEPDDIAGRADPEGFGRLLCKLCWAVLVLKSRECGREVAR